MSQPLIIEKTYNASVGRIWKALTDKDQMKQWYFDIAEFKPEVGFKFQFIGVSKDGKTEYLHLCEIKEVIPEKKLSYSWRYDGLEGDSLVTFELFPEGEYKTRLKFTHSGLETFPADHVDIKRGNFIEGWTMITGTLLPDFVEKLFINTSFETTASAADIWHMLTTTDIVNQWAQAFGDGVYIDTTWQAGAELLWKIGTGETGVKGIIVTKEQDTLLEYGYYDDHSAEPGTPLGEYSESFSIEDRGDTRILNMKAGPLSEEHFVAHEPLWEKAAGIMKGLSEKS